MIKRKEQLITSPFGPRVMDNIEKLHRGVDLRCVNFENWKDQKVITPEKCKVLRLEDDCLIVEPLESCIHGYRELKFIHLDNYALNNLNIGQVLEKGTFIGYCCEYPKGKHLHFETWVKYNGKRNIPINPVNYFEEMRIKFSYK